MKLTRYFARLLDGVKIALWVIVPTAVLVGIMLHFTSVDPAPAAGKVATKLNDLGAVIYISDNDAASVKQQSAFGPFWDQLNVVDCSKRVQYCTDLQIGQTPEIVIPAVSFDISGYQDLTEFNKLLDQIDSRKLF